LPHTNETDGLVIKKAKPDGNCFFRSIAEQVYGNEEEHERVREEICNMLEDEPELFNSAWCDESLETYKEKMPKERQWGGETELRAAAQCYQ